MTNSPYIYTLEERLVRDFVSWLTVAPYSPWGIVQATTEFNYQRGRTDIVAMTQNGDILAFEAKLSKWRDALHQAYRNTCFAHFSYIVVPYKIAFAAARYAMEFSRRAVGICYPSQGQIVVLLEAQRAAPLQTWLSRRARELIMERNTDVERY